MPRPLHAHTHTHIHTLRTPSATRLGAVYVCYARLMLRCCCYCCCCVYALRRGWKSAEAKSIYSLYARVYVILGSNPVYQAVFVGGRGGRGGRECEGVGCGRRAHKVCFVLDVPSRTRSARADVVLCKNISLSLDTHTRTHLYTHIGASERMLLMSAQFCAVRKYAQDGRSI